MTRYLNLIHKRDFHRALAAAYEEGLEASREALRDAAAIVDGFSIPSNSCSNRNKKPSRQTERINQRLAKASAEIRRQADGPCIRPDDDGDIPF